MGLTEAKALRDKAAQDLDASIFANLMAETGPAGHTRGRLTSNRKAEQFMLAGNATVTVVSLKTGKRHTYKVAKPDDFNPERPIWFVHVLKGADNDRDFGYIGQIVERSGLYIYHHGRKCWPAFVPMSAGFDWLWNQITMRPNDDVHRSIELWHEGRCGKCGRKLTVPASIESGFGPECITQL